MNTLFNGWMDLERKGAILRGENQQFLVKTKEPNLIFTFSSRAAMLLINFYRLKGGEKLKFREFFPSMAINN
jgi:hypothetical protein